MSHALATTLHRGRKAASNIMAACLASSREARRETGDVDVGMPCPETRHLLSLLWRPTRHQIPCRPHLVDPPHRGVVRRGFDQLRI